MRYLPSAGHRAGQVLPNAIKSLSPIAWWKLGDYFGAAIDSTGNGRDGSLQSTGYIYRGARGADANWYFDFGNGASSYIDLSDINAWSLNNASGLTIFALINPDSVTGTTAENIISKGTGGAFEWSLTANAGTAGRLQCQAWTPAGLSIMSARSAGDPLTASWQAVCVAFPTPSTNAAIPMYRNNNADITTNLNPGTANTYTNNTANMLIGWRLDTPANQYFHGGLAHIALFAGQLTAAQVGILMDAARHDGWCP